jgi:hypothetical protein
MFPLFKALNAAAPLMMKTSRGYFLRQVIAAKLMADTAKAAGERLRHTPKLPRNATSSAAARTPSAMVG